MNKIKVVHHSKTIGFSGTDRTAQLFCKYLSRSDKYEPFIIYREGDLANTRIDIVKKWLGDDHVIPYTWVPGKSGRQAPYMPEQDNIFEVIQGIDPQIMHYHFGGYNEWPVLKYLSPKARIVTTNIFGYNDPTFQADLTIYISAYIKNRAGAANGPVLYNPVEQPVLPMTPENKELCRQKLLDKHNLPRNAILIGRVGRADNFDPISLRAFREVEQQFPNAYYLVVNACDGWHEEVRKLGISNVCFLSPIVEDDQLSNFYRGLDIYAHARHDGECCPCNIQEAMMHGIPVVSHESGIYNGQSEILDDSGFVVPVGDWESYRDILVQLIQNPELLDERETGYVRLRDHFGRSARRRAMRHFEAEFVTGQLEQYYDFVLER